MVKQFNQKFLGKKSEGFSLVELMVAVGIITVLASLAVPRFQVFMAKAKQSEAKTNLQHIYVLQNTYFSENNRYAGFSNATVCAPGNVIGFRLDNCNARAGTNKSRVRYNYSAVGNAGGFAATAQSKTQEGQQIVAGCNTADVWIINQNKSLQNTTDGVTACLN